MLKDVGSRPLYSCKASFGMPSSHMAVMAAFCFLRLRDRKASQLEKGFWIIIVLLEGCSRVLLNYHTTFQVITGSIYGLVFAYLFVIAWKRFVDPMISGKFGLKSAPVSDHS